MADAPRMLRLRADHLPWREIDGEIIALDPATSSYVSINGSGTLLWHELVEGTTTQELAARLTDAYGIEREQAQSDVDAFVSQLGASGWLET